MARISKFYVVWAGQIPGIYESWDECQKQIKNSTNARFKGFPTRVAADNAYNSTYESYITKSTKNKSIFGIDESQPKPVFPSLAVDAACNTVTGDMEYQGVDAQTKRLIFHQGPYPGQNPTHLRGFRPAARTRMGTARGHRLARTARTDHLPAGRSL